MSNAKDRIEEEAVSWLLRLRDGSAEDWEAFTGWLEADPAHRAAYDEVALLDRDLEALPAVRRPVIPSGTANAPR